MKRSFSNKGQFSAIKLIKTLLHLTEPLLKQVDEDEKEQLFLGLSIKNRGKKVKAFGLDKDSENSTQDGYIADMFNREDQRKGNGLFVKWELTNSEEERIKYDSRKFRKAYKREAYEAVGSLADVSSKVSKHHGANATNTTAKHYLNNESNKHLHEQAVRNAQTMMMNEVFDDEVIITDISPDTSKTDIVASIVKETGESEAFVEALLSGQQDVFIAHCRDFYNSPHSKAGKPCQEPWLCFECKNALWTSRILPRLLMFFDFIGEQRKLLRPQDWHVKFFKPWSVIKYAILPKFDKDRIDAARMLAQVEKSYIPAYWKVL